MEEVEKIKELIKKFDNNDCGFYFYTQDTKGNPNSGVGNIYEHAKLLIELGYKAYILHNDEEYYGVGDWLGEEYTKIPHVAIQAQNHEISNKDFIIIPEVFANVIEQWARIPAKKIVLSQSYDYIFELLKIGTTWGMYGVTDAITTTTKQATYINSIFPTINTHIVPKSIPDYFKADSKPKKPIVALLGADQKQMVNLVKEFYLKNPQYKWISFRDLTGMTREGIAKTLGEACVSVWIDRKSSFGTFPLESIQCDTPVIGVVPDMIPDWMIESIEEGNIKFKNNGFWTNNPNEVNNLLVEYIKLWLEDSLPISISKGIEESKNQYTVEEQKEKIKEVYSTLIVKRKAEYEALLENITKENKE